MHPEYSTLEFKRKYKNINDTLFWLIQQSLVSIPYCIENFGNNNSLRDIWAIGKANLIYRNDAPGIEQLQSAGTLFENNIHNIPGAGDCDCFTIFTIAMALASGVNEKDINIFLQSNSKKYPSHILTAFNIGSDYIYIDFTQPSYNTIRKYNYQQIIPIEKFL